MKANRGDVERHGLSGGFSLCDDGAQVRGMAHSKHLWKSGDVGAAMMYICAHERIGMCGCCNEVLGCTCGMW